MSRSIKAAFNAYIIFKLENLLLTLTFLQVYFKTSSTTNVLALSFIRKDTELRHAKSNYMLKGK